MKKLSKKGTYTESCPICIGQSIGIVTLREKADKDYNVCRCSQCGLFFVPSVQIFINEQANTYGEEFYDRTLCADRNPIRGEMERRVFDTLLRSLEKHLPTHGRMLDVGCGDGIHLKLFHDRGWEVSGTEISDYAARHVQSKYGFEVFLGELKDAPFKPEQFDFIQMRHVIEHLSNPMPTLNKVRELLKPTGILRIDTPTIGLADRWMPKINMILSPLIYVKRYLNGIPMPDVNHSQWGNLHPPEHNLWFTVSAMKEALKRAGFEILSLSTAFRGDPDYYPSKFILSGARMGWWNHLWTYVDALGANFGRGSILIVYARKPSLMKIKKT